MCTARQSAVASVPTAHEPTIDLLGSTDSCTGRADTCAMPDLHYMFLLNERFALDDPPTSHEPLQSCINFMLSPDSHSGSTLTPVIAPPPTATLSPVTCPLPLVNNLDECSDPSQAPSTAHVGLPSTSLANSQLTCHDDLDCDCLD